METKCKEKKKWKFHINIYFSSFVLLIVLNRYVSPHKYIYLAFIHSIFFLFVSRMHLIIWCLCDSECGKIPPGTRRIDKDTLTKGKRKAVSLNISTVSIQHFNILFCFIFEAGGYEWHAIYTHAQISPSGSMQRNIPEVKLPSNIKSLSSR